MKTKILLSFAIFFYAAITANAQINEGRYLLGGSFSFSNSNSKNPQTQTPEVQNQALFTNIQLGKLIKNNTVAGIMLSYGYTYTSSNNPVIRVDQYGAGVFYRKYKPIAKDFYLFGEADALYSYSKNKTGILQVGHDGTRFSSNLGSLSFTPGISYFICKRIQMELLMQNLFSISYAAVKNESTFTTNTSTILVSKSNGFSANVNVNSSLVNNFGIGFKFLLGK